MNPVARVDDTTACPLVAPNTHTGGPLANATPVHLHANGRPVIRLGDYAQCVLPAPRASSAVTRPRAPRARDERRDYYVPAESPTLITGAPVDATARTAARSSSDPAPLAQTEATPIESEPQTP